MKQIMTYIQAPFKFGGSERYAPNDDTIGSRYLRLQVDNSIMLGYAPEDIIIGVGGFDFDYRGVTGHKIPIETLHSSFATKIPSVLHLIDTLNITDNELWIHDVDCYALLKFEFPKFDGDIAMVRHSINRMKPQMGCLYVKNPSGIDILRTIAYEMKKTGAKKEESFTPGFFARPEYSKRRTWLNYEFNLFRQSEFSKKYKLADKPIKVLHGHTQFSSIWNCFIDGKNSEGIKIATPELKELFIKHGLTVTIER